MMPVLGNIVGSMRSKRRGNDGRVGNVCTSLRCEGLRRAVLMRRAVMIVRSELQLTL
jgi:hypothetical protein